MQSGERIGSRLLARDKRSFLFELSLKPRGVSSSLKKPRKPAPEDRSPPLTSQPAPSDATLPPRPRALPLGPVPSLAPTPPPPPPPLQPLMVLPWPFTRATPSLSDSTAGSSIAGSPKLVQSSGTTSKEGEATLATLAMLLEPFQGKELPTKARTDPTIPQKPIEPMTITKLWQYLPFLASQGELALLGSTGEGGLGTLREGKPAGRSFWEEVAADHLASDTRVNGAQGICKLTFCSSIAGTSLTKAFLNHHLYGPPKPSWGVELTLFTAFLREAAAYSHLSSLARLRSALLQSSAHPLADLLLPNRSVLDLGSLLPTPKDGIVTPITFRVKNRGLRGFLAEADAAEDGKRLVTGEWVINKRLWKRMQNDFAMNKAVGKDRVILYLHGGASFAFAGSFRKGC